MLALSRNDLKTLVPMADAVELMKIAFRELSAGRAQAPVRTSLPVDDAPSAMLMMPGFVPASGALGFKTVNFFAGNPQRGLPTIHAIVCLIDPENGIPMAIMEGGYVTALRTGAVSGAATDLMARPESRVLTVIGTGVQGVTQAAAVCAVRPIERIIGVDLSEAQLDRFRTSVEREWPELSARVETTTDVSAAVRAADVICTSTTAKRAVFDDGDVKPGTHINAVGAFTPEMQEVPVATCARARIVVDNHDAIMEEAGDLLMAIAAGVIAADDLHLELGHVVDDPRKGRTNAEEITFFKSVGNAVQDVVVARFAVDAARKVGAGQEIDLT